MAHGRELGAACLSPFLDKIATVCYNVCVMKRITNTLKEKYYTYQPGEFLPVYIDGKLANRKQFHAYKIRWILEHRQAAVHQFTHSRG